MLAHVAGRAFPRKAACHLLTFVSQALPRLLSPKYLTSLLSKYGKDPAWATLSDTHCTSNFFILKTSRSHFIPTNLSRLFWTVVLSSRLCGTLSPWPWQYLQLHSSFPHVAPAITRFGSLHWSVTENIPLLLNSQENLIQINRNASNLSVSHCGLSATNDLNHSERPAGYSTGMRRVVMLLLGVQQSPHIKNIKHCIF